MSIHHALPDAAGHDAGRGEVQPDGSLDAEAGGAAQSVLASLLLEHDIAGKLAWLEQAAVLHPAVELEQHPVFGPRQVGKTNEGAVRVVHLELHLGLRQSLAPEGKAGA